MSQERNPHREPERWLLRVDEVAALLGLSRAKVYGLIQAGRIPSVRIDSSRRVPADALRAWVEQQTLQAGSSDDQADR